MALHGWSHDILQEIQHEGQQPYWNVDISVVDEDICTKFDTKMEHEHDHVEMPTWLKTEPEVNSHDIISRTSETNVGHSQGLYDFKLEINMHHLRRAMQ